MIDFSVIRDSQQNVVGHRLTQLDEVIWSLIFNDLELSESVQRMLPTEFNRIIGMLFELKGATAEVAAQWTMKRIRQYKGRPSPCLTAMRDFDLMIRKGKE